MTEYLDLGTLPLAQVIAVADGMAAEVEGMGAALTSMRAQLSTALRDWKDSEAGAVARRIAAEHLAGQGIIAAARAQEEILRRAATELKAAQLRATETAHAAAASGFTISDAGVVTDPTRPTQAHTHTAALQSQLRIIADVDRRAAAELDAITNRLVRHGRTGAQHTSVSNLPPPDATPTENRQFWDGAADRQRAKLIRTQPAAVGGMDGLPASARHEANVSRLDLEIRRWTGIKTELQSKLDSSRVPALDRNRVRLWQAQRKIDDAGTLKRIVNEVDSTRLLSLDLHSGDRGMASISFGDTDTADHIGVTVPGMNTNVSDSFWSMSDEARMLKSLAEDLLNRAGRHGETVATIIWLGYEPPQITGPNGALDTVTGGVAAAMTRSARRGAPRLAWFFEGLNVASLNPKSHLTALGHSYGSYTTALALQDPNPGQPVDDAVFYGSAGINAFNEEDLGLADGHGFVMLGDRDKIGLVDNFNIFGPEPTTTNLVQLSTAATTTRDGVGRHAARDHADYGRPVGDHLRTSGFNMAAVMAGLSDWAVRR